MILTHHVCVESLVMGKLHRDLATFMMQCCTDDENKTNRQCVEVSSACLLIVRLFHDTFQLSS